MLFLKNINFNIRKIFHSEFDTTFKQKKNYKLKIIRNVHSIFNKKFAIDWTWKIEYNILKINQFRSNIIINTETFKSSTKASIKIGRYIYLSYK